MLQDDVTGKPDIRVNITTTHLDRVPQWTIY